MNAENNIQTINIGILGFGTVGQGAWKHLEENGEFWQKILGVQVIPRRASVRSLDKQRKVEIPASALTTDSQSVVDDPEIDLICELIGGIEEAK
ncbi:MAG: homoserine dehydrogenase, partial [Verrucomicrobiota bacterium]|nr:homoserine dehydrogenase [Verrucomicrobiota bacterium]